MQISRRGALLGATAAAAVAGVPVTAQAVEPLLSMEQERLALLYSCNRSPDQSDEALEPHFGRLDEIEERIYRTPAQTPQGVAVKLRLWGHYYGPFHDRRDEGSWWRGDLERMDLSELGFATIMRDLERLAGEA